MQEIRAGELLRRYRKEKKVSAKNLCKGICSENAILNYENGERAIDTLLLERFLERMGIVPSGFALMLNDEEYIYYMWRDECYEAVELADWEKLETLLTEREGALIPGNDKVQEQFYGYMKAILLAEKYGKYKEAGELLFDAAHKTILDISKICERKLYLGELELQIVVLYLCYGLQGKLIAEADADPLFQKLAEYCGRKHVEDGIRVKNYVRIVCVWMKYGASEMPDEQKMQLCENALKFLKGHYFFFDITGLLEIYIPLLKKQNSPEVAFYRKQYEAFSEVFQYAGMKSVFRPEILGVRSPMVYLLSEYLQYKRREMRLTQEKVSEGICEPETYSRLETGVRAPSRSNRVALAERLEIGWHCYRGELDTDNREVYAIQRKERIANVKNQWKECLNLLKELERLLDMTRPVNQQYIKVRETLAKYRIGSISAQEAYEKEFNALQLTTKLNLDDDKLVYYSGTELECIGYMGQILREMGKYLEAVTLLETVLSQMSKSKVDLKFHWYGINFVMRMLSGSYFSLGNYQKDYDITYQVYKEAVSSYNGGNLSEMLDSMSDGLEHIGEQHSDEYKKLCRLSYYAADFYDIPHAKKIEQEYYETHFEKEYQWY